MFRVAVRWTAPVLFAFLGWAQPGFAQGDVEPEKVKIQTIDGVELRAFFYQSSKKNAPTILVLHNLGSHSQVKGWKDLAAALQPSYSVMLFDFRGHGESKEVDPTVFWKYEPNRLAAKQGGTPGKGATIDYKNFDTTGNYYPVLVNDIAAVKGFLDRRSDSGGCNTSSFILIGDGKGAALGAIWLNSEYHRYRMNIGAVGITIDNRPEGKDTIAAIFLSPTNKLGKRRLTLSSILDQAGRQQATPMVFMYGDSDEDSKTIAKGLEKALKPAKGPSPKYTGAVSLGKTKLAGAEMLEQKSLKVDTAILKYLENVVSDKGNEWSDHDYRRSQYVWRFGAQPIVIKPANEMNAAFDNYERFTGPR
jgi:predicted esterase